MALVIEDGSGVPNANSWATRAAAIAYANAIGNTTFAEGDTDLIDAALVRGARYIIATYGARFPGAPTNTPDEQNLPWPRQDVQSDAGWDFPEDYIPPELINAQIEAAMREFASPGILLPDTSSKIQKAVTVGPIHVEYAVNEGSGGVSQPYPSFAIIDGIIAPILNTTSGVEFLLRA